MKIIVGLGNPGAQYRGTRHNVGFMTMDALARRLNADFALEKYGALIARTKHDDIPVMLMKPLTFMNLSGQSVSRAVRYTETPMTDLLVVADDVNLPLGKVRLRVSGSAGGHNGLRSIIEHLASDEFPRLRIGVGMDKTAGGLVEHVLGKFHPEEKELVNELIAKASDAALCWLTEGIECAMNRFN